MVGFIKKEIAFVHVSVVGWYGSVASVHERLLTWIKCLWICNLHGSWELSLEQMGVMQSKLQSWQTWSRLGPQGRAFLSPIFRFLVQTASCACSLLLIICLLNTTTNWNVMHKYLELN